MSDPYIPYVAAAYGSSILIIGGLVIYIVLSSHITRKKLMKMEADRRSSYGEHLENKK